MNENKFEINADFSEYKKAFLEENAKLNLISKNDEKVLFEKHIYIISDGLYTRLIPYPYFHLNNFSLIRKDLSKDAILGLALTSSTMVSPFFVY